MLSQLTRIGARNARLCNGASLKAVRALSTMPSNRKEENVSFIDTSTGKTGAVVLAAGAGVAAFANDMIVLAHPENVVVLTFFSFLTVMYKKVGPILNKALDDEVINIAKKMNQASVTHQKQTEENIALLKVCTELPTYLASTHEANKKMIQMSIDIKQREKYDGAANLLKSRLETISNLESKIKAAEQADLVNAVERAVINHFKTQKNEAVVSNGVKQLSEIKFAI